MYGRLTVLKNNRQRVLCRCSCGREKWVGKHSLLYGRTTSCGCFSREVSAESLRKTATVHSGWGTREWNLWWNMNRRCQDPSAMGYENYGGRGITVCAEWVGSGGFTAFLEHMGKAPSPQHTLDRLDNEQGYKPGNLRWATPKEQARNRRDNHLITAFGRQQCLAAWAEEVGLSPTTIRYRILKGWVPEDALTHRGDRKAGSVLPPSSVSLLKEDD
jgi:hypothetical protein